MTRSACVLLAALCACSAEVVTTEPAPLPGVAGARPPARPERVRIIQVTPADGALHVAPLTKIVLLLNGEADPASVNAGTVTLHGPGSSGEPLAATVSYDPTARTITLAPRSPLGTSACLSPLPARDSNYRIATQALRAWNGVPIDDVTTRFTTVYNTLTSGTPYVGGDVLPTPVIGWYDTTTELPDGRLARLVHWSWGLDGVPHTADDHPVIHNDFSYSEDTTRLVSYTAPGADGIWLTADDVVQTYVDRISVAGHYRQVGYSAPGPNGVWFDDDDVILAVDDWLLEADGRRPQELRYLDPGPDGKPFTADDVLQGYERYAWGAAGAKLLEYADPGPDASWRTADDVVDQTWDVTLDSFGEIASWATNLPGPDGKWLTADDAIHALNRCSRDGAGLADVLGVFDGAGPDGVWFTPDDKRRAYARFAHAPTGALTSQGVYDAPGPDGQWLSADDHLGEALDYDASR